MARKFITNKEKEILQLILAFRFINSKQIQEFLGHKDIRRINKWLKDLKEKGLIERTYQPIFGTLTKPAVFSLSASGRGYIKQNYYFSKIYMRRLIEDKKRSKAFRIKCQLVADCFLIIFGKNKKEFVSSLDNWLSRSVLTLKPNQLYFLTPVFYSFMPKEKCILLSPLKPDAYTYKMTTKGANHTFFYFLDSYISRFALHAIVKHVFEALSEETWENKHIYLLRICFLCPNNEVLVYLKRRVTSHLEKYYGADVHFLFTTRNKFYNRGRGIEWITLSSTN